MRKDKVFATIVAFVLSTLLIGSFSDLVGAQVIATSRITGTVADPRGAVIPNAEVVVKNNETGNEYKTKTADNGSFTVPSLPVALYTVTITATGFKQTVVTNVKTEIGTPASVEVIMEVGAASESVTVSSGAEVLQKESTAVGSVITGRQITELPFASRDALDLVLSLPGTATPGRPRTSSINGLPKGAINISIDGINVQDNTLRSSDGFFTYIRPRVDAIEEVQVSTATPGAEASAGGAIHIRFVTKAGTNEWHGGGWWYNRQRAYNSNYYFNNLTGTPRAQVMLNQWGLKIGGPITPWLKDRAFFFFAYDEFRLPEQQVRTRTILSPDAELGIFRYPGGPANGVDVLALIGSKNIAGAPGTRDPLITQVLGQIRQSTASGQVKSTTDPNVQQLTFTNTGGQTRYFPTIRFDVNANSKNHVEFVYNYQDFNNGMDFLNSADPAFPKPVPQIFGGQDSTRFEISSALRTQLSATLVNEARFGLTGGTVLFRPNLSAADFAPLGGIAPIFPLTSNPFTTSTFSRRNAPVKQFTDNLSWAKGKHNLNFGGAYNLSTHWQQSSGGRVVPGIAFGVNTTDPINGFFTTTAFPGATTDQLNAARSLYAMLTGRVTTVGDNFNGKLDEKTKKYSLSGTAIERNRAVSFGMYVQDYFKLRPNLNVNMGIRWEPQLAPVHKNAVYIRPTFDGLFGISGPGNLFKPGATAGAATAYVPVDEKSKPFNDDYNNIGPSVGIAWSPHFNNSMLKRIFGESDKSVFRASYAISFVTGGFADFTGVWGNNPGLTKPAFLRGGIEFTSGSVLLRNGLPAIPTPSDPVYPTPASVGISAWDFDPSLRTPTVQSWSFGIQRELSKSTAFELRYVGNHSVGLVRTMNLNEVNIFENGFLDEFIAAQKNLAISLANGGGSNFRNQGLPGQVNLPIFTASFGSATSTQFTSSTFITRLQQGQAGSVASLLGNTASNIAFQTNRVAAGLPANLFTVNPSVFGAGANLQTNYGGSTYNGLQIELRRRMSSGLLMSANYTWSKALTDIFFDNPHTLRAPGLDKGPSPWDIRHAFKANYIYDFPIGPGRRYDFRGPLNVIGKLFEGWQTDGIIRWQSGRVFPLTSGRLTFNQFDSGVDLVGMSRHELQSLVKIRKDPAAATRGTVFYLPQDVIDNTLRAFGLLAGAPTGRYIAPPSTPGKLGSYVFLYGPQFFRADMGIVKRTRITERVNIEVRFEMLNALNNANFYIGSPNSDAVSIGVNSLTFGQTGNAYQDVSTTSDPGGRLGQFVLRINF